MDPLDFSCGECLVLPGEPCEGVAPEVHEARIRSAEGDALADDWSGGAVDFDGDGLPGAVDFDDPSNWM